MLDKLGGIYATRPRSGPHKLMECLPLALIVRNRLKYALNNREISMILKQRLLKVDGKVRTDSKYPAGFMDVITIEKTGDKFRLLYDTKGRFVLHQIGNDEVHTKLCKVKRVMTAKKRTPFISTHDGRTIRFPDPNIRRHDTVILDLETGKIKEWLHFKLGCLVMTTGGANIGRVGTVLKRERHPGSFDIVQIKDARGNTFATRLENVFVIGAAVGHPMVSLPKAKGLRRTLVEDREKKLAHRARQRKAGKKSKKSSKGKGKGKGKGKAGKSKTKKSKK